MKLINILSKNKCNIAILIGLLSLVVLFINYNKKEEDCGCD